MCAFSVRVDKNDINDLRKQLNDVKKYLSTTLQKNVNASGSRLVDFAKRITPIGEGEPEGGRDRPRPGTHYGDLRKGWYSVRSDRSQKMASMIANNTDIKHSISITHDIFDKGEDYRGRTILKVLEGGSQPHDISVVNKPWLIYWARDKGKLVFKKSVRHPGTEKIELLTRIKRRGELLANVLAGRTEQEINNLL